MNWFDWILLSIEYWLKEINDYYGWYLVVIVCFIALFYLATNVFCWEALF